MSRVEIGLWQLTLRAKRCVEALRKNGFDAEFHPDVESVRARVLAECEKAESIGFGGRFRSRRWGSSRPAGNGKDAVRPRARPPREEGGARIGQLTCDLFLTGTNAVTLDGCLVNLDMIGNRTNAMTFGPRKTSWWRGDRRWSPT